MMSSSYNTPTPIYSDEKVVRLIRTYIAITVNACLVVWQEVIILRALQEDAKEMVRTNFMMKIVWSGRKL
jgi:hypothetical protein